MKLLLVLLAVLALKPPIEPRAPVPASPYEVPGYGDLPAHEGETFCYKEAYVAQAYGYEGVEGGILVLDVVEWPGKGDWGGPVWVRHKGLPVAIAPPMLVSFCGAVLGEHTAVGDVEDPADDLVIPSFSLKEIKVVYRGE